jgi:hypothetical protein
MRFEEWWMEQEFNPLIYSDMEEAWNAGRKSQREIDAGICRNRAGTVSMFSNSTEARHHRAAVNGCAAAILAQED